MVFPRVNLDDRTFQDLVDEAKRLIPEYLPEWTNHNVSDPGVALIELFAWMTELTLFRLNQVPDRVYESFLDLVGIAPYSSSQARGDLTFMFASVPEETVSIPMGTEVASLGDDPIIFLTSEDLEIRQPDLLQVMTVPGGPDEEPDEGRAVDTSEDLFAQTEVLTIFGSEVIQRGDAAYFGFAESLGRSVLRIDVEAEVKGVGIDPNRPPLSWEVWSEEGWIPCEVRSDTTGGLNRDGVMTLVIPSNHLPLSIGGARAYWIRVRLVAPVPDQPDYEASPAVRSLLFSASGGIARAEHAETRGEEYLGISDGSPSQSFAVAEAPVLTRNELEYLEVRVDDSEERWLEVSNFAESEPGDRHFRWDSSSGIIEFGPRIRQPGGNWRQHGSIPEAGSELWLSGYRVGGGSSGNVGPDTLTVMRSAVPYVGQVTNRLPMLGGVDAESLAEAKHRAPLTLISSDRAVTAADHERLAIESDPGIRRAFCLQPSSVGEATKLLLVPDPFTSSVDLTIDHFSLSESLLEKVSNYLEPRRIVGTAIELGAPQYVGVSVACLVRPRPGWNAGTLRQVCEERIAEYLSPTEGGVSGKGWPLGQALTSGAISQLVADLEGVQRVEEVALFETDLRNEVRIGEAVEVIRLESDSLFLSFRPRVIVK